MTVELLGVIPLCLWHSPSKETAHSGAWNMLGAESHWVPPILLAAFWCLTLAVGLVPSGDGYNGLWGEKKWHSLSRHLQKVTLWQCFQTKCGEWPLSQEEKLLPPARRPQVDLWAWCACFMSPNKSFHFQDWFHSFPIKQHSDERLCHVMILWIQLKMLFCNLYNCLIFEQYQL